LKKQKARLTSLLYDTLYSNDKYNNETILPTILIDREGIDSFMKDYKEKHEVTTGMLGQYNA